MEQNKANKHFSLKKRKTKEIQRNIEDICTSTFIAASVTTAKTWKQPTCLAMDEWTKEIIHTYNTHNGIVFSHEEKKRNPAVCNN